MAVKIQHGLPGMILKKELVSALAVTIIATKTGYHNLPIIIPSPNPSTNHSAPLSYSLVPSYYPIMMYSPFVFSYYFLNNKNNKGLYFN